MLAASEDKRSAHRGRADRPEFHRHRRAAGAGLPDRLRRHELPQWAAETTKCKWLGEATGPAVGAKFRGVNKHKGRIWAMGCQVTDAEPGSRFAFDVSLAGVKSAHWRYDIEPTDAGCRVTESTRRITPRPPTVIVNRLLLGIRDRDEHNQRNIERTLEQLKAFAEK